MDSRPIGVFDSGLGGLTAVKELLKVIPGEDIVYFGDTGRVPYGTRSDETLMKYARQDINFLLSLDIRAIVVACGTVSSIVLDRIKNDYEIPIIGVVESAANRARLATHNRKIGIIGTPATIRSGHYAKLLRESMPDVEIFEKACSLFVPLVEAGRFQRGDAALRIIAEEYLLPLKETGLDTLIMGCTHYPLLRDVIADIMGENVSLIDPGAETAAFVRQSITKETTAPGHRGSIRYFVSDSVEGFTRYASMFLGSEVGGMVEKIDIDRY